MDTRHKLCLGKTTMNWSIALPPLCLPAASFFTSSWLPGASLHPAAVSLGPPLSTDPGPPFLVPQHCVWRCQPGCYCPLGQVLSADGTVCVQPAHCSCLDLLTGERHRPGAQLAKPDGCNYW